jgi:hypothetical protein
MKRSTLELRRPYRGDYRLLRAGREGTFWQAPDGRLVRLAAAETEPPIERLRLSTLGLLVALVASGAAKR